MSELDKMPQQQAIAATPEDAAGIQKVMYDSWTTTFEGKDGATREDVEDRMKHALTEEAIKGKAESLENPDPLGQVFVVKNQQNEVIGYCRVEQRPDKEENEIAAVHALPSEKGKGVGKQLLLKGIQALRAKDPEKNIMLDVAESNEAAIGFYEKFGFINTGEWRMEEPMKSGAQRKMIKMVLKSRSE